MSGIAGVWSRQGTHVDRRVLALMSDRLSHRGPDGEGTWVDGSFGMACQLNKVAPESASEVQPVVRESAVVLGFDGRLDNRDELFPLLPRGALPPDAPDPELLAQLYAHSGERFVDRLNGDFALALFDARARRLLLARDSLGIRPLYYYEAGEALVFASEIKALFAHPAVRVRPDDHQLAEYLLRGYPGEEGFTFFEGVRIVRAAHVHVFSDRSHTARQYWDFPTARARPASFEEYRDGFRHHFSQAVARRLRARGNAAVAVSGGLDSSAILCTAAMLSREHATLAPVHGISYVDEDGTPADERKYLDDMERQWAVCIERFPVQRGFMDDLAAQVMYSESPMLELQWRTMATMLELTRTRLGARVLLSGHWGDQVLFDESYLVDLVRSLALRQVMEHLREIPRWYTDADPKYYRRRFFRQLIQAHVPGFLLPAARAVRHAWSPPAPEVSCYAPSLTTKQIRLPVREDRPVPRRGSLLAGTLYRRIRSRYDVLSMEWQNKIGAAYGVEMSFPFLDRDLLSFIMGVPGTALARNGVPRALLREGLRRIMPDSIADRRWKADYSHLEAATLSHEYEPVYRYLTGSSRAAAMGYVAEPALRLELGQLGQEELTPASCKRIWGFGDLVGLEAWLRAFCPEHEHTRGRSLNE